MSMLFNFIDLNKNNRQLSLRCRAARHLPLLFRDMHLHWTWKHNKFQCHRQWVGGVSAHFLRTDFPPWRLCSARAKIHFSPIPLPKSGYCFWSAIWHNASAAAPACTLHIHQNISWAYIEIPKQFHELYAFSVAVCVCVRVCCSCASVWM